MGSEERRIPSFSLPPVCRANTHGPGIGSAWGPARPAWVQKVGQGQDVLWAERGQPGLFISVLSHVLYL